MRSTGGRALNAGKDGPTRVLVVDDSETFRRMLSLALSPDPRVEIVGDAADPFEAREKIKAMSPDVITLDVEMPGMNGLEFLSRLMRLRPTPVVMISTLTREGSEIAVRALGLGAVECIDKRSIVGAEATVPGLADTLIMASRARLSAGARSQTVPADQIFHWNGRAVFIGSSTGGVDALTTVLSALPADGPPIVVAQHMPAMFLTSFAERLDRTVAATVRLAAAGDALQQGEVLLAPGGDRHVLVSARGRTKCLFEIDKDAAYVPLIDKLFASAADLGNDAVGVILTGMGRDGSEGLLKMRRAGAHTIAQSGETAVIDGMPRAARDLGAAVEVCDLGAVGAAILASTGAAAGASLGR